jgi:hypothetical protein
MTERSYWQPTPVTDEEAKQAFQHGSIAELSRTLVALALYDTDWKKVQTYCLEFLEHPDAGVRAVAATCIGHLARIHKQLDLDIVLPALYRHQSDQGRSVAGNVDNALSDIEIFMHVPVKHDPSMVEEEDDVKWEIEEEDDEDEHPLTAEEIKRGFNSEDTLEIKRTLVALALHSSDWRKTEAYCLEFLEHQHHGVRGIAAECISHLIYNQHHLDVEPARTALLRHLSDPSDSVVKQVTSTLRDIERFVQEMAQYETTTEAKNEQGEGDMVRHTETSQEQKPINGQRALDNSVSLPSSTTLRIGVDLNTGEIVVFDITKDGRYGGFVRSWQQITQEMKDALIDMGLLETNGRIIIRDARGHISGYGTNVITGKTAAETPNPLSAEKVEQALQSNDPTKISRALLTLALHDPDWHKTQEFCLKFLEHPDDGLRGFAAECISHLIYNQHHLDVDRVRAALLRHQSEPHKYVARKVTYALSDLDLLAQNAAHHKSSKG